MTSALFLFVAGLVVVVTGFLAVLTLRDPVTGLEKLGHRIEQLPEVMAGRYLSFFVLAIGAAIYGDVLVMLGLLAGFTVASAADTIIYASKHKPYRQHLQAALMTVAGMIICGYILVAQ